MIAKHLYEYLEQMVPDDLELIVRSPGLLDPMHRGSWLEFYLCQTLARTTTHFRKEILDRAKSWWREKVEYYAKAAKKSTDELAKEVAENQQFCAKIAMSSLEEQAAKAKQVLPDASLHARTYWPNGGQIKP